MPGGNEKSAIQAPRRDSGSASAKKNLNELENDAKERALDPPLQVCLRCDLFVTNRH